MNNTKDIVIASVKGLAKNCMNYVPIICIKLGDHTI